MTLPDASDDFEYGIEVDILHDENFLKIKETLTRIGIASRKDKTLYQSCHILHKRGRYYIVHFKEMFMLDGLNDDFPESDVARRNTIAHLLEEWGLLRIIETEEAAEPLAPMNQIKVISYRDKENWNLEAKYTIGR